PRPCERRVLSVVHPEPVTIAVIDTRHAIGREQKLAQILGATPGGPPAVFHKSVEVNQAEPSRMPCRALLSTRHICAVLRTPVSQPPWPPLQMGGKRTASLLRRSAKLSPPCEGGAGGVGHGFCQPRDPALGPLG